MSNLNFQKLYKLTYFHDFVVHIENVGAFFSTQCVTSCCRTSVFSQIPSECSDPPKLPLTSLTFKTGSMGIFYLDKTL